jgi:hypothetical protein
MASLLKRNQVYYLVFARRFEGRVEQRVFSPNTPRKAQAERLKVRYEEQYAAGQIDPFGGWTPRQAVEQTRRESASGETLEEVSKRFFEGRSHVRSRTLEDYRWKLGRLVSQIGRTLPVRMITEADIRSFCFMVGYSVATQQSYLRFCKMFCWLSRSSPRQSHPPRPSHGRSC